ncbi:hypothetical protein [Nitratidesulfovibrio vulgaris]|uniref:Uncharacterized protein n=1 Tax=Nitratidesulfovibrio vulgaris (strain ATCC 29579 / DSM 644 / CCUG 34227 / NCIMB 8303 / VKM B-1760 / Hildenborough) TaxID=882 RepID=Q727M6_NITV2|nr:hypothetical protein [Nitratidesulfovibrio vulgaris]AAS97301.1 hypothetical protein DVU_2829 [Nitratidesulfovibrio vulgaris str. Hildenborough]ADP87752.1 hypothetical protein Deval_2610 [Nitratidesulfovibrio vulgaris RCH1]
MNDKTVLDNLVPQLPPLIARKASKWFTGGGLSPKTLANDDKLGRGPRERLVIGEQIYYPREAFVSYLESKGVRHIVVPEL